MTDYDLGKASGKIEIDYSDTGVRKAIVDLDKATDSSEKLDKQLASTERSLSDTDRQFQSSGTAAQGYRQRLQDVEKSSKDVNEAEKAYKSTLLDSKSTLNDVEKAHARVTAAKQKHTQATNAERNAYRALNLEMLKGHGVMAALAAAIPALERRISGIGSAAETAERKTTGLARGISGIAKAVGLLGPEADLAVGGLELISRGFDKASSSSGGFIKGLAGFEATFAKISGLSLTIPSLGGLGAIGGASVLQGVVEVADAVRQLSGALGLIPAVAGGVGVVMGTLKVALHGVDSALKDMFADDPKKFLEDIKNMGPVAAQALLQVAQFRNQFLAGGAAVQDSFFSKITADIKPLIQTWLPALVAGGSKIAGVLGGVADQFSKLLEQPQTLSAFNTFIDNIAKGLQSMQPAMKPLLDMFTQLSVVGSSFFQLIGPQIAQWANLFNDIVSKANASGALQEWIATAINAFDHLGHIVLQAGEAFNAIFTIADKFGGGGLLGWLDKLTQQLDLWTQSADGQKTLMSFFSTLNQATEAFLPVLKPLSEGILTLVQAFVQLGINTSTSWVDFFKTFASVMQDLKPNIEALGPSVNTVLGNLGAAMKRIADSVGPQLPQIFEDLANAFVALLPQIPPLVTIFTHLIENVGPQLPKLFDSFTQDIEDLIPLLPSIGGAARIFVSALTLLVEVGGGVIKTLSGIIDLVDKLPPLISGVADWFGSLPTALSKVGDSIETFFSKLPEKAVDWGKKIIKGLIDGLSNNTEGIVTALDPIAGLIVHYFKTKSPAKIGPLHDTSPNEMGERIVNNMAAGMVGARPALAAAATATASTVTNGIGRGTGGAAAAAGSAPGAPAAGGASSVGGGGLLPPWIASASNAPLNAYLKHQFPDNDGLKGLAARFGKVLKAVQDGTNLFFQNGLQPVLQGLGNQNIFPGLNQQRFRKIPTSELAAQERQDLLREQLEGQKKGPTWADTGIPGTTPTGLAPGDDNLPIAAPAPVSGQPADLAKMVIQAGRTSGLSDDQIKGILAVGQVESGLKPEGFLGFTNGQAATPQIATDKFLTEFRQRSAGQDIGADSAGKVTDWDKYLTFLRVKLQGQTGVVDWQGNQQPSPQDFQNRLLAAMKQLGPSFTDWFAGKQTWDGLSGAPGALPPIPTAGGAAAPGSPVPPGFKLPPGTQIGHDGSLAFPSGVAPPSSIPNLPPGTKIGADGSLAFPNGVTPPPGALSTALNFSQLPNVKGAHPQLAYALAAIQQLFPGALLTAGKDDHPVDQGWHPRGQAIDIGAPGNNPQLLAQISNWLLQYTPDIEELIHAGPGVTQNIKSNKLTPAIDLPGSVFSTSQAGDHSDHVHLAITDQMAQAFEAALGSGVPLPTAPGATTPPATGGGVTLPGGQTVDQLLDSSKQNVSLNDKLLQAYLAGNPALAAQIGAAKTPGASDDQVLSTLNQISSTITGLKTQDAVGNKNTIDALQSTQSDIAQGAGYAQAPSAVTVASSIANGVSSIATSIFSTIQSGLDALSATQDITDRLVYGISNTKDVSHIIDDFQKYITFAANIAQATGSILSTIGGVAGAAGSGDPSGATSGAALALSAAGQVASLIGAALQGVNAAIDYGQEIAQIASGYVGRFLSTLTGPTQMLGDVRFLLNENTGQLLTYSEDNPLNKNTQNVPGGISARQGWGGGNPNPQVSQQLNVYAGPGQSPAEMMNQTMWMVNTSGTMGALAGANF